MELELQKVVSLLTWVMGTGLSSSGKAEIALIHSVVSSAPGSYLLFKEIGFKGSLPALLCLFLLLSQCGWLPQLLAM